MSRETTLILTSYGYPAYLEDGDITLESADKTYLGFTPIFLSKQDLLNMLKLLE